ncbi:MAG: hypothetical protein JWM11_991, partial [Planctomycetaceae bacterium]|nr:hypothetical protein [Planctomycetaceae bacterium]
MFLQDLLTAFCQKLSESARPLICRRPIKRKACLGRSGVENLEQRALLSVNTVFDVTSHELTVTATHGESIKIGTDQHGNLTVNGHSTNNSGSHHTKTASATGTGTSAGS